MNRKVEYQRLKFIKFEKRLSKNSQIILDDCSSKYRKYGRWIAHFMLAIFIMPIYIVFILGLIMAVIAELIIDVIMNPLENKIYFFNSNFWYFWLMTKKAKKLRG